MGAGDVGSKVSNCLAGGDGKLIDNLGQADLTTTFDSLEELTKNVVNFDETLKDAGVSFSDFNKSADAALAINNNIAYANILDIQDPTSFISLMTKLTSGNLVSARTGCNNNPEKDVWVPDFKNSIYNCQGLDRCNDIGNATCNNGAKCY